MFKRGDVRLVAAAIAAISLHALLFILLPESVNEMSVVRQQGGGQIELLAPPARSIMDLEVAQQSKGYEAISAKQQPEKAIKQTSLAKPVIASKLKVLSPPVTIIQAARQQAAAQQRPLKEPVKLAVAKSVHSERIRSEIIRPKTNQINQLKETHISRLKSQFEKSSSKAGVSAVPQNVQNRILAEMHYPRQARRRGWQGKAEFQFDVQQQSIQTVTLLASTGYPILDRAAHRGLIAASHVALSNGLYRMPVVFRLQ